MLCSSKRGDSALRSTCELCGKKQSADPAKVALRDFQNTEVVVRNMRSETVVSQDDGSKYTEYVFRCCATIDSELVSWDVGRRFSDFHRLHLHLKKKGEVRADFPSKNPFAMIGVVVRSREIALTDYLNSMLSHCNDEQCLLLSKFLRVNKHLKSRCCVGHGHDDKCEHHSNLEAGHSNGQIFVNRTQNRVGTVPSSSLHCRSREESSAEFTRVLAKELIVVPYSSSDDDGEYEKVCSNIRGPKLANISESKSHGGGAECVFCDDDSIPPQKNIGSAPTCRPGSLTRTEMLQKQKELLEDFRQRQQSKVASSHSPADSCTNFHVDEINLGAHTSHVSELNAGVGLVFVHADHSSKRGAVMVDEILPDTPAEADGTILVGDYLLSVDGVVVSGKDLTAIRSMIVGSVGSLVTLEFEREPIRSSRPFVVTLRRGLSCEVSSWKDRTPVPSERTGTADSPQEHAASPTSSELDEVVQAIFAFPAQRGHELNLIPGDMVAVMRKHKSGWWEGRALHSGAVGWFPSNHVQLSQLAKLESPESDSDTSAPKALSAESSGSAQSLSLRSTVHGSLSANSCDSAASSARARDEQQSNVDEVCSWLKTVDVLEVIDKTRSPYAVRDSLVARLMNAR